MRVLGWLASSRAVLIIVGGLCGLLAHTTMVNYTVTELPGRNVCVMALGAVAIIGLGTAVLPPNSLYRGVVGLLLIAAAGCRIVGFSRTTAARTDGVRDFISGTNAVWAWALIAYLGFLIWARRNVDTSRKGARSAE